MVVGRVWRLRVLPAAGGGPRARGCGAPPRQRAARAWGRPVGSVPRRPVGAAAQWCPGSVA